MNEDGSDPVNSDLVKPAPVRSFLDATAEHIDHDDVAALRAELQSAAPNHAIINQSVERLNEHPQIGVVVSNWWNDPKTQAYIAELNAMGI